MPLAFRLERYVCQNFVFGCSNHAKFQVVLSVPELAIFKQTQGTDSMFCTLQNKGILGCTLKFARHPARNLLCVQSLVCCF